MCIQAPPHLVNTAMTSSTSDDCGSSPMSTSAEPSFSIFEMQEGNMIIVDRPSSASAVSNNGQFVFDWSDFPLLGSQQDEVMSESSIAISPLAMVVDDSGCSSSSVCDENKQLPRLAQSVTSSFNSSSSSSIDTTDKQDEMKYNKKRHTKKVSWDSNFDVRTYSLIVGDHPCCRDALPIQLGWEYIDEEKSQFSVDEYDTSRIHRKRQNYQPKRLSYMERKYLLQSVSGWNEQELSSAISYTHGCQLAKQKHASSSNCLQQLY